MIEMNGKAAGRGDGDEPLNCQVCGEALVEGGFTPLLGYWIMCDDCVAEVAAQVMEVLQRRLLSGGVHHVVLNKDMEPVAVLDRSELRDLQSAAPEGKGHGATVHPIRQ